MPGSGPGTTRRRKAMSAIDETKQFIPLNIAVLTISDTRTLADDKSGTTLADRLTAAGHHAGGARDRHRRRRSDPRHHPALDRRSRRRCDHHHRRHRLHRPRRHAGGGRAAVREAHGRLFDRVPHAEPRQDRHLDDPEPRHRRRRRRDLHLLPAGLARRLPRRLGRHSRPPSSTTARGPAISSRSCRGSTSICAGRKRRARQPDRRRAPSSRADDVSISLPTARASAIGLSALHAVIRHQFRRDAPPSLRRIGFTARAPRSRRSDSGQSCDAARSSPAQSRRPDRFFARRPECSGSTA